MLRARAAYLEDFCCGLVADLGGSAASEVQRRQFGVAYGPELLFFNQCGYCNAARPNGHSAEEGQSQFMTSISAATVLLHLLT